MTKTCVNAAPIRLEEKIKTKQAHVAVLGLGYVGLPLVVEFARAGFVVHGIDTSAEKVQQLRRGLSYVEDVGGGVVGKLVKAKKFFPTHDFGVLRHADAVIICVPTPLRKTQDPDVSYIVAAVEEISRHMAKEQLIVLESTTYPGTCEEVILPILAREGRVLGRDFHLAFSPERVDPGNKHYQTRNIPKVIGGVTPSCTKIAQELYSQAIDTVIPVSSARVAEMIKLLENTFRSVNIGLVNEIALMCSKMGMDVWEVIEGASTKPFGFIPFYPGPGLGGHCLPIDPLYLSWKAKFFGFEARFIELAARINASMPAHVVDMVVGALNTRRKCVSGANVLIVGVAYKKNVSDTRESPAIDIAIGLKRLGAKICYNDPHVNAFMVEESAVPQTALTKDVLESADCVVIVTDHSSYDFAQIHRYSDLIVDTRNALRHVRQGREKIHRL